MKIAPRLYNKKSRVRVFLNLPDVVKYGLKQIAKGEDESVSWTIEEVVYKFFGIKRPRFVGEKPRKIKKNNVIKFRKRA